MIFTYILVAFDLDNSKWINHCHFKRGTSFGRMINYFLIERGMKPFYDGLPATLFNDYKMKILIKPK